MELGSWHIVHAVIVKHTESLSTTPSDSDWRKNYPVCTTQARVRINPIRAMYIGQRTLHEGITSLEYEEDSFKPYPVFERKGSVIVYVFVSDERTNPFFALPSDVDIETTDPIQHGGRWREWLPATKFQLGEPIYLIGDPTQYSVDSTRWNGEEWEYYITGAMQIVTANKLTREQPIVNMELVKLPEGNLF